ncbi:DEAD/DEAH box helicase [Geoanaerobacter pelophilus]|uniref:DEAD/DEAH box helicase n=1 Tax=Geoanaerobacter pelophilus TaxID=60036 RepID=A0ABQ0MNW1_9BACT|nr:SNF2-related protein [Geoanaerobacter pelophilus]GAW68748.1 DEAD/DEAH box helicase [Geoanaerobacter pelophilus]
MDLTAYHAKYYAHELTKRCSSDSLEKLTASLADAQVDLNPHQVDAALFAFRSPLSRGAILADEVGLGKTIEAGIVLSQIWAERKRKILIIVPSSLRKQWNQELLEKFFLPSAILESKSFNQEVKQGKRNPFEQAEIVITSYQFARNKADLVRAVKWDLVVIDEAHRLRNVYKTSNKIARAIKEMLANVPKLLLTATPLQNSLMELYGLVSFIDEYIFGDIKSYKNQFARLTNEINFDDLKARIAPICKRTLRRQVLEYIKYTNRIPITQEFVPTEEEAVLYDMVSEYLRRDNLQALPASQRSLMTLVLRKLLASSTFAIAGALDSIVNRLKAKLKNADIQVPVVEELADDFETLDEIKDEWEDDAEESMTSEDREAIQHEITDLEAFRDLAVSIAENAKGKSLIQALKAGFAKAVALGASEKAIIFTESRRTQNYLVRILSETEHRGKIVLFNGSNSDEQSKQIYHQWYEQHKGSDRVSGSRTADMRSALVDYFREEAQIMIATEAAAEGINLQFCSLVVNYDLPWNPQRIEQRIGRCHRYGQKHDVVVVNFLNRNNAADQRVFELLAEKFALFDGVFGASDEVLGSIESGVDFEKRIVRIYQECRSSDEIQASFNELQRELETEIDESMKLTRKKLLENFDEEVHEKLRVNLKESTEYLNKYENWLWALAKHALQQDADFHSRETAFNLKSNPFKSNNIPLGQYRMGRHVEDGHVFRIGHPLALHIMDDAAGRNLPEAEIAFDYTGHPLKISILESLVGKSGYLSLAKLSVESFEEEDHLIFSAVTDSGTVLEEEQAHRLFTLPGACQELVNGIPYSDQLTQIFNSRKEGVIALISSRNSAFFDDEMEKLEKWAEDLKSGLEFELKELDREIKCLKTESKKILKLEDKLKAQKDIKELEKKRGTQRRTLFDAQDEIDKRKEGLIEGVEARLMQQITSRQLFAIRWCLN